MTEDAPTHAVEQIEQWSGKIQNLLKMLTGRLEVLRPFVVLDRDGTIIEERRYLANPSTITLVPGAVEGLRRMSELGLGLVIVTNQSAVGRGYISKLQLDLIHQRLCELLEANGVVLDGLYFCPHKPGDRCGCRKPKTGLVEAAARELGIDARASFVVGDKASDIELGRRIGATTFLVATGYGREVLSKGTANPDHLVKDLVQAVEVITSILQNRLEGESGEVQ